MQISFKKNLFSILFDVIFNTPSSISDFYPYNPILPSLSTVIYFISFVLFFLPFRFLFYFFFHFYYFFVLLFILFLKLFALLTQYRNITCIWNDEKIEVQGMRCHENHVWESCLLIDCEMFGYNWIKVEIVFSFIDQNGHKVIV